MEFLIWPCIIFFHGVLIYVGMIKMFELESHDMELESTFYTTPNQAFHT